MTAITSILNSAEESIATLTGCKVKLRISRGEAVKPEDIDLVLMAVEMAFGIDTAKLRSKSRKVPIPDAKRLACMLLKERMPLITLMEMAGAVGLKDHTSVSHHLKIGRDLLETDGAFISRYNEAKAMLDEFKRDTL